MNRTSSRFSKGHDKELDRLAERINNSVLSKERESHEPVGIDEEEDDEELTVVNRGVRDSSSELPRSVIRANKLRISRKKQRGRSGTSDRDEIASDARE